MLKNILLLVLGLVFFQTAKAIVPDTLLIFYKNNGRIVKSKDSADYFRFIMQPNNAVDKDLFRVYDFYMTGTAKMVATSLNCAINLIFDGSLINYYPNGKRKSIMQFKGGKLLGQVTNYYPNGEIYQVLKVVDTYSGYNNETPSTQLQISECRDSTGKVLATNGKGHVIFFDEDFKKITNEGDIVKGKREGKWEGIIGDTGKFVCTFHNDVLKTGTSFMKSGMQYNFAKFEVEATYDGGRNALLNFIYDHIQIPESAKKHGIKGRVYVAFIIESTGDVSNARIISGLIPSINEEALRVISMSPAWTPKFIYGIPVASTYEMYIDF